MSGLIQSHSDGLRSLMVVHIMALLGCLLAAVVVQGQEEDERTGDDAFLAFQKACALGNPLSCFSLGAMYEQGQGVKQDKAKAASLYKKSCEHGHARACSDFGFMLLHDEGVKKDGARSARFYNKACDKGRGARAPVLSPRL